MRNDADDIKINLNKLPKRTFMTFLLWTSHRHNFDMAHIYQVECIEKLIF